MNRREAIDAIMSAWAQRDQEFVVGQDEGEASDRELHEALNALGVTNAEIDGEEGGEIAPPSRAFTMCRAPAFTMCRLSRHDYTGQPEVTTRIAGRAQCNVCGTIKSSDGKGTVTFTYPEVQS